MTDPQNVFVPGGRRGKVALALLLACLSLDAAGAIFVWGYPGLDAEELSLTSAIYSLISLFQLPILLATSVAFSMWWHRVYRNLTPLGASGLQYTPSRAVWAFFIPFVNLVRPEHVGQEIWKASDPEISNNDATTRKLRLKANFISAWWSLFIFAGVAERVGLKIKDPSAATVVFLIAHLLSIGAAIFAIMVVKRIEERQMARFHRLGGPAAVPTSGLYPSFSTGPAA